MDKFTRQGLAAFCDGTGYRSQEVLGAHFTRKLEKDGVIFRTWAPNAKSVSVVGDFNGWRRSATPMRRHDEYGVWIVFVPGLVKFDTYKYSIESREGVVSLKADPFALHFETPPANASKIMDTAGFKWSDKRWLNARAKRNHNQSPMNIYEVHPGSWRRYGDGNLFDYGKLAGELAEYAADMGYTHVELMPITEYPDDSSLGYEATGYFAPTSRYGQPRQLMQLVNTLHKAGIGVILDWSPACFSKDGNGLGRYDGTPCFEYADPIKGEHKKWGTAVFDFGRPQVQSFLISSALFWIEQYHIDGLRVGGVTSMLYLDYDREEWVPNARGGKENLEAALFLKKLNSTLLTLHPDVLTIAEESTAWPMVTKPPGAGGLGFSLKWNMGRVTDMLEYTALDPIYRAYSHDKLTFSTYDAFSENYVLPFSHNEVAGGKESLIERMPGSYEQKFAGARVLLGYMMSHPGKKLLFMGCEFGQFAQWDFRKELDWLLLDYEAHRQLRLFVKALNHFYLENPALWQIETSGEGFRWVVTDDAKQNIVVFRRLDDRENELLVICNFTPVEREQYRIGIARDTDYRQVFSTDEDRFGGDTRDIPPPVPCEDIPAHGQQHSISLRIPPMSALWLCPDKPPKRPRASNKKTAGGR